MDSKKQHSQPTKKGLSKRSWFWIRTTIAAIVVLVFWTLISGAYIEFVKSIVLGLIKAAGYYREYNPKVSDALMSPAIPFVTLMIGTWGTKLIVIDKKINWKLIIAFVFGTLGLIAISIYGQYLSFFMSITGESSAFMTNLTGFLIATGPVLIPIVVWTAISYKEIGSIFFNKK
jgi:hypothetical protein